MNNNARLLMFGSPPSQVSEYLRQLRQQELAPTKRVEPWQRNGKKPARRAR